MLSFPRIERLSQRGLPVVPQFGRTEQRYNSLTAVTSHWRNWPVTRYRAISSTRAVRVIVESASFASSES
jgi:hypothetical protein